MRHDAELTLRALLTGILLGALLTPSNVYSGLKIGWTFNMSIIALLIGFGFWRGLMRRTDWGLRESNISQTTASAAAAIISGGLVAPIPAYTLITGRELAPLPLIAWVGAVSLMGVWIGWVLRGPLIVRARLAFPAGLATLETMRDVFAEGHEAGKRLAVLAGAALVAGLGKGWDVFVAALPRWSPSPAASNLTLGIEPSFLLLGFGAIIGIRAGISLALGGLLAWGVAAPMLINAGAAEIVPGGGSLFGELVEWLVWPGVGLMVGSALTSLGLTLLRARPEAGALQDAPGAVRGRVVLPAVLGLVAGAVLVVAAQRILFGVPWVAALLSIPVALVLAVVAARVVGETAIPPIGAMGKLAQLGVGVAAPGQPVANLMPANAAGGSAGQAADLLNDLKVGHGLGATVHKQIVAQVFGILVGSVVGSVVYLALVPDPQTMLLTAEWPAPAVATWKAVAEAMATGLGAIPVGARWAALVGVILGVALALLESGPWPSLARWMPSGAALGLAFVIPASIAFVMALGAAIAWLIARLRRGLGTRFTVAAASGLVAGESIMGVIGALWRLAAN